MSQDIYQQKMDQILEDCDRAIGISDDVCIYGKTIEAHDRRLRKTMDTARKYGLVFNKEKCKIRQKQIKFYGLIWDENGSHPDPEKRDKIKSKPIPANREELQQFLGMIQYLSLFIPKLSSKTAPLRSLRKKDTEYQWNETVNIAFQNLEDHIHENICLAYFKPNAKTTIQVDASMPGLGATLINDNKIVAFASKRLTDTKSRYANIERELLAVVFGCERVHTYVYGKEFQIESDHKPLENIQNKNIAQAPPRLQRMLLRLQPYDAQILYKPGKEMRIPDYLSRTQSTQDEKIGLDLTIHTVDITVQKQIELQEATEEDEELKILKQVIVNGWPENVKDTPKLIRNYWSMKDCLSVQNGLVTKGECIVIPKSMQNTVLKRIHDAHQGIEKCQLKARNSVYWRGINKDIEMMVRSCEICREHQRKNTKETMIIKEHSTRPFQNIAANIFEFNGQQILLVGDQYSKMLFVKTMKSVMSTSCIEYLKAIFTVHGIPERLYTDNAKYFVSNEFHNFAIVWEFTHITSSPRYPQSNGFIERMVQTIKNTLKMAKQSKMDYQMALLCLRTTPLDNHLHHQPRSCTTGK